MLAQWMPLYRGQSPATLPAFISVKSEQAVQSNCFKKLHLAPWPTAASDTPESQSGGR